MLLWASCGDDADGSDTNSSGASDSTTNQAGKSGTGGRSGANETGGRERANAGGESTAGNTSRGPNVPPAECHGAPTHFSACGGDLVGKWRLSSFCLPSTVGGFRDRLMCAAADEANTSEFRTLLSIKSGGMYQVERSGEIKQTVTVPKSCMPSQATPCSSLAAEDTDASDGSTTTISETDTVCEIEIYGRSAESSAGAWSVDDNKLTLLTSKPDSKDTQGSTAEYCVDGSTLTLAVTDSEDPITTYTVYERL